MYQVSTRQVHLDFHTSEHIPGVGSRFSRSNFQRALKTGRVNSITVFARCHHGWCYYPTKIGKMHPTLEFDLLGSMIEACHEIGVRAPVYLTNGWVANEAIEHPEWMVRDRNGLPITKNLDTNAAPDDPKPNCSWYEACPGGGYKDYLLALIREICGRYEVIDGFFIDINCFSVCWCDACKEGMAKHGLNAENDSHSKRYFEIKWLAFFKDTYNMIKDLKSGATVFFNNCASPYHPEYFPFQTHFEMEDMPTVWDGYDRLPARAVYFNKTGKDYLGQTGKFHKVWGEFGTYKNADALKYECATMASYGAKCNVGDQLHPLGEMNMDTYKIIGKAYEYIEKIEPWCYGTEGTSNLGIYLSKNKYTDMGLWKILLEKQLDFEIVTESEDLSKYEVVILPDSVTLDSNEAKRLQQYISGGGGVLITGKSGLDISKERFMLDVGVDYKGSARYKSDYTVITSPDLVNSLVASPFLFYEAAERVAATNGEVLASIKEPYFDRTYGHYCGHINTPYREEYAEHPAVVQNGRVVYMAHAICKQYNDHGMQIHRDFFINILRRIYKNPVLGISMPSAGRVHLARQKNKSRYVLHITYASPIQRGEVRVVEDMVPIYDTFASIKTVEKIKRVYLAPQMKELDFKQSNGQVSIVVPEVVCHQMVVLEYKQEV